MYRLRLNRSAFEPWCAGVRLRNRSSRRFPRKPWPTIS